ncbi:MAG: LysE family transporter [Breznakibacter sp.]|nr:LysE family transporter [Breznakibacter sp.]
MQLKIFIEGILIGILASIPLGPIGVLCVQRTLSRGRMSGFVSGMGAALSDLVYAAFAVFSLSLVVGFVEDKILYIQILGVIIMVFMGLRIYFSNPAVQLRKQNNQKTKLLQDFISTFLYTIANPLVVFFFVTLFAAFNVVESTHTFLNQIIVIVGVYIGACSWWFILTSVVNLFRSKINLRRLYLINRIAGATIVVLGVVAFTVWLVKEYYL